jgi:magnesium transporter
MTENHEPHYTENVQDYLQQVQHLLDKHALVEAVAHQQEMPRADHHELVDKLLHNRHLAELREKLGTLHSADIAYILKALPHRAAFAGVGPSQGRARR